MILLVEFLPHTSHGPEVNQATEVVGAFAAKRKPNASTSRLASLAIGCKLGSY